jgi:6-phosphofructokinase
MATDRLLACRLGNYAVKCILNGVTDHCVGLKNCELITIPLEIAIQPKKIDVEKYYRLIKILM